MADTPTSSAGTDGAANPTPATPAAAPPAEPPNPPTAQTSPPSEPSTPAPTPEVATLRAEIADLRAKADKAPQDVVDKIAKALGIATGDAPTVEQVTEQLGAAQRDACERAVDLAVYRAAPTAGADPDALLDSTAFRKRVADLDHTADGFADKVTTAIAEALKTNSRLATTPAAAPRSGGQITGGSPTGGEDLGSLTVEDYIKRTRKRGN